MEKIVLCRISRHTGWISPQLLENCSSGIDNYNLLSGNEGYMHLLHEEFFLIFCGKRVHERMFFGCESSLHWCKAASGQIWYGNFKVVPSWFSNTPEGYTKLLLIEFGFYRVSWTKLCMTLIINTKPMGHRSVKGKERGYITYYEVREDEVSKIVICSLSGIGSGLELRRLQRTDAF